MNEGIPLNVTSDAPSEELKETKNYVLREIIDKLNANNTGPERLSEKEIEDAANTYISHARENGTQVDVKNVPLEDLISARKALRGIGVPIVSGTGEVLHADSESDVRKVITQHNEEKNEN